MVSKDEVCISNTSTKYLTTAAVVQEIDLLLQQGDHHNDPPHEARCGTVGVQKFRKANNNNDSVEGILEEAEKQSFLMEPKDRVPQPNKEFSFQLEVVRFGLYALVVVAFLKEWGFLHLPAENGESGEPNQCPAVACDDA
uniref:Uncharacterized protein n=1 Tax=Heterosigma akashiwo TaxID=2829 RepID=A0A7S3YL85_HETAK